MLLDTRNILLMITALINFVFGLLIYSKGRHLRINFIYTLNVIAIIGWVLAMVIYRSVGPENSLFWCIILYLSPTFIASSFLYFTYIFPSQAEEFPSYKKLTIFLGNIIIIFLLLIPGFIIKGVIVHPGAEKEITFSSVYILYVIYIASYFSYGFWKLFRKYRKSQDVQKNQIVYLLSGYAIAANSAFITNLFMPWFGNFELNWYGQILTLFMVGFAMLAILKYHLFEIRVVLTEILVIVIAFLLLIQVLGSQNIFEYIWKGTLFFVFLFFGYLLVRSVIQEIERRTEIQKLYKEVDKLSKTKSEFLSIASHQLRTPLSAIKGYISLILEGDYGKLPKKIKQPLENVYQSNERLIKLVNDLLNLSRLEAGKIDFTPEILSLKEMILSIIEELKINAEKNSLYLKIVDPPEELIRISADKEKLRQVILNLIDNAIKYTKKGGITLKIEDTGLVQRIIISDTGEGMTQKEIKSLFHMFTRATAGTQMHTEGSGVGLYVAKKFIDMHNGRIWVESQGKGKGSTFYIELPKKINQAK